MSSDFKCFSFEKSFRQFRPGEARIDPLRNGGQHLASDGPGMQRQDPQGAHSRD